jgi:hypothetical protein
LVDPQVNERSIFWNDLLRGYGDQAECRKYIRCIVQTDTGGRANRAASLLLRAGPRAAGVARRRFQAYG